MERIFLLMKSKEFTIYIQNCLFKKKWDQVLNLELKFATKKFNPQINLLFNLEIFLPWQSYLEYKLSRVGIASR